MNASDHMIEIELATKAYAQERRTLSERVQTLEDETRALQRRKLPGIKGALARARDARDHIVNLLHLNPGLFVKPRTVTVEGIKVGFQKRKGSIGVADPDRVVELIKKKLPDLAADLIQVKETPRKSALAQLTAQQLTLIGCTVDADTDEPLVKETDGEVDKLVAKLLQVDEEGGSE